MKVSHDAPVEGERGGSTRVKLDCGAVKAVLLPLWLQRVAGSLEKFTELQNAVTESQQFYEVAERLVLP